MTVYGATLLTNGRPIRDVTVSGPGASAVSGRLGRYSITIPVDKKETLHFRKRGFVPLHKTVRAGGDLALDTVMRRHEPFEAVDPGRPANVRMAGAAMEFGAGSLRVKKGGAAAATARISLTPFDPTKDEDLDAFPGEFQGTRADGSVTDIETFGFMKIIVEDEEGRPLDLAKGKKASIRMPISPDLADKSPDTIPLWYFDEAAGKWKEHGTAVKTCRASKCVYEAEIDTIASWWNTDKISISGVLRGLFNFGKKIVGAIWRGVKAAGRALASAGRAVGRGLQAGKDWVADGMWGALGRVGGILFGRDSAEVQAGSRETSLSRAAEMLGQQDNPDFSFDDVKEAGIEKGFDYDIDALSASLEPGQDIVHETRYDVPGEAAYSVETSAEGDAWEASMRRDGAFDYKKTFAGTDKSDTAMENALKAEFSLPRNMIDSGLARILGGEASLQRVMRHAERIGKSDMTNSEKREAIYNNLRQKEGYSDDQTLQFGTDIADFTNAKAGVCRHLSSALFAAYNRAGVETTYNVNAGHAWVQSANEDGSWVSIDPNRNYNYREYGGKREGSATYYNDNTMQLPGGERIEHTFRDAPNAVPAKTKFFCSMLGPCVKMTDVRVLSDRPDGFAFDIFGPTYKENVRVVLFEDPAFSIESITASEKRRASATVLGETAQGYFYEQGPAGDKTYYFLGRLGGSRYVIIKSKEAPDQPREEEEALTANVRLTGVDYQGRYETRMPVREGPVSADLMGRADSKAILTLSLPKVASEPIEVNTPGARAVANLDIRFGAVIVPVRLREPGRVAFTSVRFVNQEGRAAENAVRIADGAVEDTVVFLVKPGRPGRIEVFEAFSRSKTSVRVPAVEADDAIELEPIVINGVPAPKDFACDGHYAVLKELRGGEHVLVHDGREIARGDISHVSIFDKDIVYQRRDPRTRETRVYLNGEDLGVGVEPKLWGGHTAFRRRQAGGNILIYDGKSVGKVGHGKFLLWGEHYAFERGTGKGRRVVWDGKVLGRGGLIGLHKDFALVRGPKRKTVLYRNGRKLAEGGTFGAFGDHWWRIQGRTVWIDGKKAYEGRRPRIMIFDGSAALYGSHEEAFFNGIPLELGAIHGSVYTARVFENDFFVTGVRGLIHNGETLFEGTGWHRDSHLFQGHWLATTRDNEVYVDGVPVGKTGSHVSTQLFGERSAFAGRSTGRRTLNHELYLDGKLAGEADVHAVNFFGEHVYWKKNAPDAKGGHNEEYFLNGKSLGFAYNTGRSTERIKKFLAWPVMSRDTEIGTMMSNRANLGGAGASFAEEWLYCTGGAKTAR